MLKSLFGFTESFIGMHGWGRWFLSPTAALNNNTITPLLFLWPVGNQCQMRLTYTEDSQTHQTWLNVQTHHVFFCPLHLLHADWDRNPPSLPFKSHKTINLTSTDHSVLPGSAETKTIKSSLDFTSRTSTETVPAKEAPTRPFVVSRLMDVIVPA